MGRSDMSLTPHPAGYDDDLRLALEDLLLDRWLSTKALLANTRSWALRTSRSQVLAAGAAMSLRRQPLDMAVTGPTPLEDVMTTTALQTPRTILRRGGGVMNERFRVTPRQGDAPPRKEDTRRVGIMRRVTAARLRCCGLDALVADVMTIVSELLTNAILHSGTTEIRLTVTLQDGFLRVEVCDGSIQPKSAKDNDQSGRGLAIVEGLVKENGGTWGVSDAGATTWCLLAVSDGGS